MQYFQLVIEAIEGNEFDSHKFIQLFMKQHAAVYGKLLQEHPNPTTVHAMIANYLRTHASELHIRKVEGGAMSNSIFDKEVSNALWRKE